jgi:hypothetical protein
MSEQVSCKNCGGTMSPGADGRTYACPYCEAEQQVAIEAEQIAANLRADLANVEAFLAKLADTMHASFSQRTRVRRDGTRVIHFELDLDKDVFVAKHEPDGIVAQHKKMVRGVALKTTSHPIDVWLEMLSRALANHANTRAHAARAIRSIKV